MSDYLSILPTEIIENILDHISMVDILSSVNLVNQRLHSISSGYSRFRLDFNSIAKKKKQFDCVCHQLSNLSTRLVSLSFDDDDNRITNVKILQFFCSITMNNIFLNLHSITLHKVDSNIWNAIRIHLPTFIALRSISIDSVNESKSSTSALKSLIFHDLLFTIQSLKRLLIHTSYRQTETITISSMQTSAIECLTVTGINIDFQQLFLVTPMLRELDAQLIVNQLLQVNMFFQPPFNLRQLSIKINRITMLEIRRLISPMIRLTHLSLHISDAASDLINGDAWIPLLTNIIIFQFVFNISNNEHVDLNTFRTRFWLDEKKWYVTFDQWINDSNSFLYTNPYSADYCYPLPFMKKTLQTESTGLEPTTFPHAEYLFFDAKLPMEKTQLLRFAYARTLMIHGELDISLAYIISCIDLSRITQFVQGESEIERPNNGFVQIFHALPHLRTLCLDVSTLILFFNRHWPQIIHLNMKSNSRQPSKPLSLNQIDIFWRSFTHLERLAFDRQSIRHLPKFFNNMTTTLSNIWIRHYGYLRGYQPQFITRQWLERNTNMDYFDYFFDNERDVHLWL